MKNRILIYSILGVLQIITGLLGSYFVFVVSGSLMLFKACYLLKEKIPVFVKTVFFILFAIINVYLMYYSIYMLLSELHYADVRPEIWICIPIALSFVAYLTLYIIAREEPFLSESPETGDSVILFFEMDETIEDMTVFALILIGWLGTFLFEFYFEYTASACIVICAFKKMIDILYPNNKKLSENEYDKEEIVSETQTHQ